MSDSFVPLLLAWYQATAAALPWRLNREPYRVWLSEVMLQQTQISTVIPYYNRFLERFPTVHDLAATDLDSLLKMWEGLGYYSRARNLYKAAKIVSEDYGGQFPQTAESLQKLPGIGRYTAGAIASIAFGEAVPVVDGNVIRVLTRLFDIADDVSLAATQTKLWDLAAQYVPEDAAGDYNQALMSLGQTLCTPRQPRCGECPVVDFCAAYRAGTQTQRPNKPKKAPIPHYDVTAGLIRDSAGRLLIAQRPPDKLLGGLWEFPGGKQESGETLPDCLQRELSEELGIHVEVGPLFVRVGHAFTHFKITLHVFECRYLPEGGPPQALECAAWRWVTENELDQYAFSAADRQVIDELRRRPYQLL